MILTGVGWQVLGIGLSWGFIACLGISLWSVLRETVQVSQRLHQVPCANCCFFTNHPALKCPVHPATALSEDAICCPDFRAVS
ncbi:MAG: hypothetical protein WCD18_14215 [Thermosynechococcaceae cyanobacterium]